MLIEVIYMHHAKSSTTYSVLHGTMLHEDYRSLTLTLYKHTFIPTSIKSSAGWALHGLIKIVMDLKCPVKNWGGLAAELRKLEMDPVTGIISIVPVTIILNSLAEYRPISVTLLPARQEVL